MTMTDPIADMLTRIRNAQMAFHDSLIIPHSKLKLKIAEVLKAEGYIKTFRILSDGQHKNIKIFLKYDKHGDPVIYGLKRVSKSSCRVYTKCKDIPKVLNGYGINILSTSKGVMTDKQAIDLQVGGEILCSVW
ncbi:MAG: 30S ribosomal protein S8 [Deltaproteobacteria bacterium]|nr:30S ribosomal protein S8 [Deltaproteobacteria bacterium]